MAGPLFDLMKEGDAEIRKKKHQPIQWTASCQHSFHVLKKALTSEPVLTQPNQDKSFIIETNASEWAIRYSLLQTINNKTHPIAYYDGQKLSPAEINYPVHEKELLAIKSAIRTWNYYIDNGRKTIVLTDHKSLKYLQTTKNPSKQLAR